MKKFTFLMTFLLGAFCFAQQPTTAPPTPTEQQADVISVFSDAFTGDPVLTPTTFGGSSNTANIVNAAGNDVYEFVIVDGDFQGFDLDNAINLSQMENLHYDLWIEGNIPVGNVFNTTVSQHGGGHLTGQTVGYVHTNATIAAGDEGQWLSFDIPLENFNPDLLAGAKDIISQLVFTYTNFDSSNSLFIDNLYFWRSPVDPNQDATLSDLTVDGTTVNNFSPGVFDYDVEVPNGTTMVPTVGATANQAGSSVSISDAAGIPGTTTVTVTAPDGTTTQDYTVSFEEEGVLPPDTDSPELGSTGNNLYVYSNKNGTFVQNFNFNAFSGNGVAVSEVDIEGNGNNAGLLAASPTAFWFYGAQWDAEDLVAGGFDFVHLNYYATDSSEFNFYLVDETAGFNGGEPEEPRYRFGGSTPDEAIVTGSWQSVFIPLDHFTNFPTGSFSYDLNDIFQYKFDGNGTVYFDNIFFSDSNTLSSADFESNQFAAFPNPTSGNWNIKSSNTNIQNIEIFNTLGRLVKEVEVGNTEAVIDASDLSSGIYFAKIYNDNNQNNTIKLIKR